MQIFLLVFAVITICILTVSEERRRHRKAKSEILIPTFFVLLAKMRGRGDMPMMRSRIGPPK